MELRRYPDGLWPRSKSGKDGAPVEITLICPHQRLSHKGSDGTRSFPYVKTKRDHCHRSASSLSTRTITLGIIAIMAVIVVAMIVPLLLHKDQFFQKAQGQSTEESAERPDQLHQVGQNPWNEPVGVTSINSSWARVAQH